MNKFRIQTMTQDDDGIGGHINKWTRHIDVEGYLDMLSGTDYSKSENAITEESTHILIIPKFTKGITSEMRVIDGDNRIYLITFADNPVGLNHHNEVYLKYGGVYNE